MGNWVLFTEILPKVAGANASPIVWHCISARRPCSEPLTWRWQGCDYVRHRVGLAWGSSTMHTKGRAFNGTCWHRGNYRLIFSWNKLHFLLHLQLFFSDKVWQIIYFISFQYKIYLFQYNLSGVLSNLLSPNFNRELVCWCEHICYWQNKFEILSLKGWFTQVNINCNLTAFFCGSHSIEKYYYYS